MHLYVVAILHFNLFHRTDEGLVVHLYLDSSVRCLLHLRHGALALILQKLVSYQLAPRQSAHLHLSERSAHFRRQAAEPTIRADGGLGGGGFWWGGRHSGSSYRRRERKCVLELRRGESGGQRGGRGCGRLAHQQSTTDDNGVPTDDCHATITARAPTTFYTNLANSSSQSLR